MNSKRVDVAALSADATDLAPARNHRISAEPAAA